MDDAGQFIPLACSGVFIPAFYAAWAEKDAELVTEKNNYRATLKEYEELKSKSASRQADKAKIKRIREQLGTFMTEGAQLRERCVKDLTPPQKDYADWTRRVEDFLASSLDASFKARFHTGTELHLSPPSGLADENKRLWQKIDSQISTLDQILLFTPFALL